MTRSTSSFFFFSFVETALFIVVEATGPLLTAAELPAAVEYPPPSGCSSEFCLAVESSVDVVMKPPLFAGDAATTAFLFVSEAADLLAVATFLDLTASRRASLSS